MEEYPALVESAQAFAMTRVGGKEHVCDIRIKALCH